MCRDLSYCGLSGVLPDLSALTSLSKLYVNQNNKKYDVGLVSNISFLAFFDSLNYWVKLIKLAS